MKITKAVLTGGGRATRLHPITLTMNKHLLPLANKPMIFHAIEKVVEIGVTDIFINVNPGETELQKHVGDGGHWGVNITFFEQTGGPLGIAHVVSLAERFIGHDPFVFYLSDNIILDSIKSVAHEFLLKSHDCMLTLACVPDPERFGVPVFDEQKKLIDVWEKPPKAPNRFAVTGIYFYGPKIFFETFQKIKKSDRGEYEISSIHSELIKTGKNVGYKEVTGWWKDTGKPLELLAANRSLLDLAPNSFFSLPTEISSERFAEKIKIGVGTKLGEGVNIMGPTVIGENCFLEHCTVGPHVSLGTGCQIIGCTLRNSIVLDHARIDCDEHFHDSIIGKNVFISRRKSPASHCVLVGDKTVFEV